MADDIIYEDDFEAESDSESKTPDAESAKTAGTISATGGNAVKAVTSAFKDASISDAPAARPSTVSAGRRAPATSAPVSSAMRPPLPTATTATTAASSHASWREIDMSALEIGAQLGGGGFAVVYRGHYRGIGDVAVKMIVDPTINKLLMADFMSELQIMSTLSSTRHQNIVQMIGAHVLPPKMCFVMELCGPSLFSVLHESGAPLSLSNKLSWAIDAARALMHLHSLRPAIIHRDVKSLNFLVGLAPAKEAAARAPPPLKLCDFGLVSTKNTDAGTPAYMAPELLDGRPFNKSVDVYAYGIMLWEMLTRSIPFAGWRPTDIKDAVIAGTRPDTRRLSADLPDGLESLVTSCWDASPAKRPDISAVMETLQAIHARCASTAAVGGTSVRSSSAAPAPTDALDALARTSAAPKGRPTSASIYGRRT